MPMYFVCELAEGEGVVVEGDWNRREEESSMSGWPMMRYPSSRSIMLAAMGPVTPTDLPRLAVGRMLMRPWEGLRP